MATLIKAKARGKFRPCRADVPKRKVLYADENGNLVKALLAYGDKIPGLKLLSTPSVNCFDGAVVRSGVGLAQHLRRFPVIVTTTSHHNVAKKIARMAEIILDKFPDSKPKILENNRLKVILWADEAKWLSENLGPNYQSR